MEQFKTCNKFCHRTFVDQVGNGISKNMCGDVGNVAQCYVEQTEGEPGIEQKVLFSDGSGFPYLSGSSKEYGLMRVA